MNGLQVLRMQFKALDSSALPNLINENSSPELNNIEFLQSSQTTNNLAELLIGFEYDIKEIYYLRPLNGFLITVLVTDSAVYLSNNNTINKIADIALSPSGYKICIFLNKIIFAYGNGIMIYDLVTEETTFSDYVAKGCLVYNAYLILYDMREEGNTIAQRIRFPDIGTLDFDSGYAGFIDLVDTPGRILHIELFNDYILVFKRDAILVANIVAADYILQFRTISRNLGTVSPFSVATLLATTYFLSDDGVYAIVGLNSITKISNSISLLLLEYKDEFSTARLFVRGDKLFVTLETKTFIYYLDKQIWSIIDTQGYIPSMYIDYQYLRYGDLIGSYGDATGSYIDAYKENLSILAFRKDNELFKKDTQGDISAYIYSKDFLFPVNVRIREIKLYYKGTIDLYYTIDGGVVWKLFNAYSSDVFDYKSLFADFTTNRLQLKFTTESNFILGEIVVYYEEVTLR